MSSRPMRYRASTRPNSGVGGAVLTSPSGLSGSRSSIFFLTSSRSWRFEFDSPTDTVGCPTQVSTSGLLRMWTRSLFMGVGMKAKNANPRANKHIHSFDPTPAAARGDPSSYYSRESFGMFTSRYYHGWFLLGTYCSAKTPREETDRGLYCWPQDSSIKTPKVTF